MFGALPRSVITDPQVSPLEKTVLLLLAMHADKGGTCFPSQGRMAKDLGVSRKSVTRAIAALCRRGLIASEERHRDVDGGRTSSLYTLNFERFSDLSQGRDNMSQGRDKSTQGVGQYVPALGTPMSQQEQKQLTVPKEHIFGPLVESYKKHLPHLSQPRKSSLNGGLGKKLAKRWKEQPDAEWWDKLFTLIAKDEWYSGRGSWSGATLRWLAEPRNLEKAEERFHQQLATKAAVSTQQPLPTDPYEAAVERERRRNPQLEGTAGWEMMLEDLAIQHGRR